MVQGAPLDERVRVPLSPVISLNMTRLVPPEQAAVPLYLDLRALTTYLGAFFENIVPMHAGDLGENSVGFAKKLNPTTADLCLLTMLGCDADGYARTVSNLALLGSGHVDAVVELLEQKVSALLEAARGQPFANAVIKAREFYGYPAHSAQS